MKPHCCLSALLLVRVFVAGMDTDLYKSEWSTEALEWTTPTNVSITQFGKGPGEVALSWPLPNALFLRVYDARSEIGCAGAEVVDSDPHRSLWWAEVRRHAASSEAIEIGQIALRDLPYPLNRQVLRWEKPDPDAPADSNICSVVAFLKGGADVRSARYPELAPPDSNGMEAFCSWVTSIMRTDCVVTNRLPERPVKLYWVDDTLEEKFICVVDPGGESMQHTFLGHIYVARDADTSTVVDWWAMNGGPHEIRDRRALLEDACRAGEGDSQTCADPDQAAFNFIYDTSFVKRHALNTVQPTVAHNYSETGYVKMPMPKSTYSWLVKWYDENSIDEKEESSAGAVGTQHDAPWYVRYLPPHLKTKLARELRPYMAEWSGYEASTLELTSCYGIRRYSRGSKLRMHVDTLVTHVVSAIINVAQEGVDQDWPLEIKGHDGQYAYVNMQPGEMLFYESAKCLHGRPQPFQGDSYANVFLHYKPTTPGVWEYGWY